MAAAKGPQSCYRWILKDLFQRWNTQQPRKELTITMYTELYVLALLCPVY